MIFFNQSTSRRPLKKNKPLTKEALSRLATIGARFLSERPNHRARKTKPPTKADKAIAKKLRGNLFKL